MYIKIWTMITTFPFNDVDHDLVFCDLFCFIMDKEPIWKTKNTLSIMIILEVKLSRWCSMTYYRISQNINFVNVQKKFLIFQMSMYLVLYCIYLAWIKSIQCTKGEQFWTHCLFSTHIFVFNPWWTPLF